MCVCCKYSVFNILEWRLYCDFRVITTVTLGQCRRSRLLYARNRDSIVRGLSFFRALSFVSRRLIPIGKFPFAITAGRWKRVRAPNRTGLSCTHRQILKSSLCISCSSGPSLIGAYKYWRADHCTTTFAVYERRRDLRPTISRLHDEYYEYETKTDGRPVIITSVNSAEQTEPFAFDDNRRPAGCCWSSRKTIGFRNVRTARVRISRVFVRNGTSVRYKCIK